MPRRGQHRWGEEEPVPRGGAQLYDEVSKECLFSRKGFISEYSHMPWPVPSIIVSASLPISRWCQQIEQVTRITREKKSISTLKTE